MHKLNSEINKMDSIAQSTSRKNHHQVVKNHLTLEFKLLLLTPT